MRINISNWINLSWLGFVQYAQLLTSYYDWIRKMSQGNIRYLLLCPRLVFLNLRNFRMGGLQLSKSPTSREILRMEVRTSSSCLVQCANLAWNIMQCFILDTKGIVHLSGFMLSYQLFFSIAITANLLGLVKDNTRKNLFLQCSSIQKAAGFC